VLLDMIGFGIIIPVLPALIGDVGHVGLGAASVIGGWMAAFYSLAQFAFAPLMGNLSDRLGRRPLLLLIACLACQITLASDEGLAQTEA